MGQSFTIRILPSRSRMVALISPTFSCRRTLTSFLPSRISWRASRTQVGHSESVSRGQPSGGFTFSHDFRRGFSDHFGVNDFAGAMLFSVSNTDQAPRAAIVRPFSMYLIGLCICLRTCSAVPPRFPTSQRAMGRLNPSVRICLEVLDRLRNSGKWAGSGGELANTKGKGTRDKGKVRRRRD